jgi:tetratricopeptide (TPR) repeat protein
MKLNRILLAAGALTGLVSIGWTDRLITKDGKILVVQKARQLDSGDYELTFKNGTILCPSEEIKEVEIEGDMSDYVPKNDDERRKLEKGFVRYEGKWLSKLQYENLLKKQAKARSERLEDIASHSDFANAYQKETKHFLVKTNSSPELLDYYSELLEAYYKLMDRRVGIKPTPKLRRTKMTVNIYRTRKDWEEQNEAGVGGGVVGYFSFKAENLNFFYDSEEPARTDWVALHECTHLLTYLIEPQSWPRIWVNEGVADYFGSSDIVRNKKGQLTIIPGKIQVDRILTVQQAIKEDKFVRLEKLFKIEKPQFTAFHYAHAWSFVYFLNNTKKYQKGFKKFFKLNYTIPKGVDYDWKPFPNRQGTAKIIEASEVRRILLESLKVKDVGKLQNEWLTFIQGIEIDAPEALYKRAYSALRSGKDEEYEQAFEDINKAIEGGVETARAYVTRAVLRIILDKKGGVAESVDDYRTAVELSPLHAGFRMGFGQLLAGHKMTAIGHSITFGEGDRLHGNAKALKEAALQMGLACELDPDNALYERQYEEFRDQYRGGSGPEEGQ